MKPLNYLKKIEKEGYEAYIVGGYVRDYLLGINSSDVDITTSATPKEISKIFGVASNDELGCVNIKNSKYNIDITTFRKEKNYFKHRPKEVSYVNDLLTDLKRRDFTINTICMDSEGNILDLLGGQKDLDSRSLKVVGNIKKKFSEDPLRMLRALRFSIIYDLEISEKELIYILNHKDLLKTVSYQRKKEEIGKILISSNAKKGIELLTNLNLLDVLEIKCTNLSYVKDYIGMWAQLEFSDKYPFSKIERTRINNIRNILNSKKVDEETFFKYGRYDSLIAADILGLNSEKINKLYEKMPIHSKDDLKISGKEIKEILNIDTSPLIKNIKVDLLKNVLSGNLSNDKQNLAKYIIEKWK